MPTTQKDGLRDHIRVTPAMAKLLTLEGPRRPKDPADWQLEEAYEELDRLLREQAACAEG